MSEVPLQGPGFRVQALGIAERSRVRFWVRFNFLRKLLDAFLI